MPELPEVETVRRILEPQLAGRTIVSLALNCPDIVAHPSAMDFTRAVFGSVIKNMGRRGKFLFIHLEGNDTLLLHLRMTGQLLVTPPDFPEEKHTHIVFYLDDGNELRFIDTRRFGRFWLLKGGEKDIYSGVEQLGPEPFDAILTADYFLQKLGKRRKSVKECLLTQSVVAGVGNIYADEVLFDAKLHPGGSASSLTSREWGRLAAALPAVIQKGIDGNCITPQDYLAGRGREYRNESYGYTVMKATPAPVAVQP